MNKFLKNHVVRGVSALLVVGTSAFGVAAVAHAEDTAEPTQSAASKDHFVVDILKPIRVDGSLTISTADLHGYADGVAERFDYRLEINAPVGSILRISDDLKNGSEDYTFNMSSDGLQLQHYEDGFYYWKVVKDVNWVSGSVTGADESFGIDFELLPEPEYKNADDVRIAHFFSEASTSQISLRVGELI